MRQEQWTKVDQYLTDLFAPADAVLAAAVETSDAAGLPPYGVTPTQGKLLMLLAQLQQAQSILEIGTLGGYSTIWLARALPATGRLISLELSAHHADVARNNIARAGLSDRVEVRVGSALDLLQQLVLERHDPFDLVFIDADKENNPDYLTWSLKLMRRGSLLVADNVVRGGSVLDTDTLDATIRGICRFNEMLADEPRLSATAFQTVGSKGYDGLAIALVVDDLTILIELAARRMGECGTERFS